MYYNLCNPNRTLTMTAVTAPNPNRGYDDHFADLAKRIKHDHANFSFSKVVAWYNEHYVTVDEKTVHRYVPDIASLLLSYMDRQGLFTLSQFHNVMRRYDNAWDKQFIGKFIDLDDNHNDKYNYRVIAECCSKLMLTEVAKIPGFKLD